MTGDNLFFNQEPPPIDQGKLFSRGDNLFDQEDDEDEYFTPTVERKIGNIKGVCVHVILRLVIVFFFLLLGTF